MNDDRGRRATKLAWIALVLCCALIVVVLAFVFVFGVAVWGWGQLGDL